MEILLILIIIFFVLPWIVQRTFPWLLRWFLRRQTRKFMNGAFPGGMPGNDEPRRNQQHNQRQNHKKKIDPSVGEYIEFTESQIAYFAYKVLTEIEGPVATTAARPNGPVENQVSDIEWEDLP